MELPIDVWNKIFESCKLFVEKRKLYTALPDSFKKQYPKSFNYPDGDKHLLNYLSIDDEKEIIFSLKIGGYWSSNTQPLLFQEKRLFIKNKKIELSFRYKNVPKTLDELFDFDKRIYEYYLSILAHNQYKMNKGWKDHFTQMTIEYELKMEDSEICIKKIVIPK